MQKMEDLGMQRFTDLQVEYQELQRTHETSKTRPDKVVSL
jgi:hypothetical protein